MVRLAGGGWWWLVVMVVDGGVIVMAGDKTFGFDTVLARAFYMHFYRGPSLPEVRLCRMCSGPKKITKNPSKMPFRSIHPKNDFNSTYIHFAWAHTNYMTKSRGNVRV